MSAVRNLAGLAAAALFACAMPAGAQTKTSAPVKAPLLEISGTWKVSSVVVQPGPTPQRVLNPNDPIYVGALLEVSKDWMAWQPRKGGGNFGDVCMQPTLEGFTLKCSYGNFGPKDAKVALFNGLLIVGWYDNVQLVLQRVD